MEKTVEQNGYRIERHSLGQLNVPKDAMYGAQTKRAVENFPISGLHPNRAFIYSMATIKRAAAEVNRELGMLNSKIANAIVQAAEEVHEGSGMSSLSWILSRPGQVPVTT